MSIVHQDCLEGLQKLNDGSAQIIIADPPYNIGKHFGNNKDQRSLEDYLCWCDTWITECLRVLKPNGTMFIFGFSEILAYIRVRLKCNVRWLVWHYTNKNSPGVMFYQRSHESILCCWKCNGYPHFNRDAIREAYSEAYLKNAGKTRASTVCRYNQNGRSTIYNVHEKGALPRDVIKIPALAGGAGTKERVQHPTQKPLRLCMHLLKSAVQNKKDVIVIPFAGSGSECVACKTLDLPFVAFEVNEEYIKIGNKRLDKYR